MFFGGFSLSGVNISIRVSFSFEIQLRNRELSKLPCKISNVHFEVDGSSKSYVLM